MIQERQHGFGSTKDGVNLSIASGPTAESEINLIGNDQSKAWELLCQREPLIPPSEVEAVNEQHRSTTSD
jgi:hypothetical protein